MNQIVVSHLLNLLRSLRCVFAPVEALRSSSCVLLLCIERDRDSPTGYIECQDKSGIAKRSDELKTVYYEGRLSACMQSFDLVEDMPQPRYLSDFDVSSFYKFLLQ